jgi:hypothetical protein
MLKSKPDIEGTNMSASGICPRKMNSGSWFRLMLTSMNATLAAVAMFGAQPVAATPTKCKLPTEPTTLLSEGSAHDPDSRLLLLWDVDNPRTLWSQVAAPTRSYQRYMSQVRRMGFRTDPTAALRASPSVNNDIVLSEAADWIRPAGCLEKLLIGLQNDRISIQRDPTEFVSVVLNRPESERVRVYFYSVNRNGIGAMTPVTRLVDADLLDGWQVKFVLHNHAFHLSDPALNGILAPSIPDAHFNLNFAKSHRLLEARITNGINTVVIPATAFARFQVE